MEAEKDERDCVIGLDLGSHCVSLALWFGEKGNCEVFADELGSRVIPSAVAYRGDEVIVGQAALAQMHKNPSNTFSDVREIILSGTASQVFVPVLEKEVTVQELVSHFFRNIHNQVKQQVGKIVRECIVSLPRAIDDDAKGRLIEAAQAGGIRIKSFISDAASSLMAYGLDDPALPSTKAVVIDMGWSETNVSVFSVSKGLFFQLSSVTSTEVCGKVLVKLLSEHCAKDFQRRSKVSCLDSSKSMTRLRTQCEEIMKHLSTGQEASIDIDSLFEGIDYSAKISRARFEDMAGIPLMRLKALIADAVAAAGEGMSISDIGVVCLAGGIASIPKVISTVKALFPSATFPRARFESAECLCIGAALHGRVLLDQVYNLRLSKFIICHACDVFRACLIVLRLLCRLCR
jgi:heat shock protein 1/8